MWEVNKNGFLPEQDPALCGTYEEIFVEKLPQWMEQRKFREEIVHALRGNYPIGIAHVNRFKPSQKLLERQFAVYSYFASAYVYATYENPSTRIPREIACPLIELSERVNRPPILSYASYCLNNWRRLDQNKPIELGNIELLHRFKDGEGREDESWFILVHVDIEAKAGNIVWNIRNLFDKELSEQQVSELLLAIFAGLQQMNTTLARMPERCRPEFYFNKVRPYIFGFKNMSYEYSVDGSAEVKTLRGETGAQSSIVPLIQRSMGVVHKQSLLTEHLDIMRDYMPLEHRNFLETVKNFNLRDLAIKHSLKDVYNKALDEFIKFRKMHLQYAVDYIEKKVANPEGTGGTPYIQWLGQLVKETEEFYIV